MNQQQKNDSYRYTLARDFDKQRPLVGCIDENEGTVLFIMLNPSTATDTEDDPTIRRCIGFAKRWGFTKLEVCNLFAARATDPKQMKKMADPIGPDNDRTILEQAIEADRIVAAWGVHGTWKDRDTDVWHLLTAAGIFPWCLGVTKDGYPRHPLYTPADSFPFLLGSARYPDD